MKYIHTSPFKGRGEGKLCGTHTGDTDVIPADGGVESNSIGILHIRRVRLSRGFMVGTIIDRVGVLSRWSVRSIGFTWPERCGKSTTFNMIRTFDNLWTR